MTWAGLLGAAPTVDPSGMNPFVARLQTRAALLPLLVLGTVVVAACQPIVGAPKIPASTAPTTGQHAIALSNADGSAVRWNPCQPILIVANFSGAPSFARAELDAAIAALRSASGLDLRFAGTTTQRAGTARSLRDSAYPSGWAPIRLTFATATELPFGSATASGWGQGVTAVEPSTGRRQYVTGQVVLRPQGWTQGTASSNPLSIMLRHELGHVVGLGHVASASEIMTSAGNGYARTWGPGDLVGLRKLGMSAGCLPFLR